MFKSAVNNIFRAVAADPSLLKKSPAATVALLQSQGKEGTQGTGNKVTDQEGSFADVATAHGFIFLPKGVSTVADGLYYLYQLKGSQKEGDFGLREVSGGRVTKEVVIDLKHSLSKGIMLNDGWFQPDVVYVISWNAGTPKKPSLKTYIALGQDIPSEEEQKFMTELREFKAAKNSGTAKKVGSLMPFIRFANKYSCERFTDEQAAGHLERVCH